MSVDVLYNAHIRYNRQKHVNNIDKFNEKFSIGLWLIILMSHTEVTFGVNKL